MDVSLFNILMLKQHCRYPISFNYMNILELGYHSDRQAIPALTNFLEPLGQVAANPPVEGASSVAPSAPGSVVFPNQTSNVPSLQGPRNDNPEGVDSKNNGNRPTKFPAQNSGLFAFSSATRLTLVKYHGEFLLKFRPN